MRNVIPLQSAEQKASNTKSYISFYNKKHHKNKAPFKDSSCYFGIYKRQKSRMETKFPQTFEPFAEFKKRKKINIWFFYIMSLSNFYYTCRSLHEGFSFSFFSYFFWLILHIILGFFVFFGIYAFYEFMIWEW